MRREADPLDGRARRILFTEAGLGWLHGFERAVARAEDEFDEAVGEQVAAVVRLGLEVYAMP